MKKSFLTAFVVFTFNYFPAFTEMSVMYGQDVRFSPSPKLRLITLTQLIWDLSHRRTASILTEERLYKLYYAKNSLTPEQKEASLQILKKHPANDLIAFIKLISSLNRNFMADENTTLNRNLLFSLDHFLQGVKTAFDAEHELGPDAQATQTITSYTLFLNLAYLELMDFHFHVLSKTEKVRLYTSLEPNTYPTLYLKFLSDYSLQKTRRVIFEYKTLLEKENKYTSEEIRKLLRKKEKEFKEKELPKLLYSYQIKLHENIKKALYFINEHPLFLTGTMYDFLENLKNYPGTIALFIEQSLLRLNDSELETFIKEVVQGLLKNFFELNAPVDKFLRSQDSEHSGSTWLSHTIDPLIHGLGDAIPMNDQITLISLLESYQASEKLLTAENRSQDLKNVLIPFLKIVVLCGQDERILNLIQKLHSGKFTDGNDEEKELISRFFSIMKKIIGG